MTGRPRAGVMPGVAGVPGRVSRAADHPAGHDDADRTQGSPIPTSGILTEIWRTIPEATVPGDDGRRFSRSALHCLSASVLRDPERLVQSSADVLLALFELWSTNSIDPVEVWTELHKRLELGHLLIKLNQDHGQMRRRILKPWKVDSTKLP